MDDKYKVPDRVILVHTSYLNLRGTLRYKGPIEGTPPGNWFGVELDVIIPSFLFKITKGTQRKK